MPEQEPTTQLTTQLLPKIQELIDAARGRAAAAVNAELTMLYWQIGTVLKEHVVKGDRAQYGQQIIERLAADLTETYGKGWSHQQLRHCLHTAETFPDGDSEILYALSRELTWTHLRKLIALLSDELGYRYVGDWTDPEQYGKTGNSNIEEKLLTDGTRLVPRSNTETQS